MLYAELRNKNWGNDLQINEVTPHDINVAQDVAQGYEKGRYSEAIIHMVKENSKITRAEMAERLGVSKKTIEREIKKMPNICYIGQGYSGYWEIKE